MSYTRVRKPPGGDSSFNIFGIPNEPNDNKKIDSKNNTALKSEEDKKTCVPASTESAECKSTVLSEANETHEKKEEEDEEKDKKEEEKDKNEEELNTTEPVEPSSSEAGESKEATSTDSENLLNPQDAKGKSKAPGYNPITGEAYGSTEKQESQTSFGAIRVRQPPGGASSKLW